tara:strand:- start:129 stop:605 length:477 start_codon:yes stop_codon:yes gene_type:complete
MIGKNSVISFEAFQLLKEKKGRLLGFDVGKKTLGVALSDTRWSIATPGITLRREKIPTMVTHLKAYIDQEHVVGLVVGLPKNLDGNVGPMAKSVLDFIAAFKGFIPYPFLFWDERFTTQFAERSLQITQAHRKHEKIDAVAAALILQSFLDYCVYQSH